MTLHGTTDNTNFLDEAIPLDGASHADVVRYAVDTPMRYSELRAELTDGRVARLRDARQFMGWTGLNGSRNLLFENGSSKIELHARTKTAIKHKFFSNRRFVARDGSLVTV